MQSKTGLKMKGTTYRKEGSLWIWYSSGTEISHLGPLRRDIRLIVFIPHLLSVSISLWVHPTLNFLLLSRHFHWKKEKFSPFSYFQKSFRTSSNSIGGTNRKGQFSSFWAWKRPRPTGWPWWFQTRFCRFRNSARLSICLRGLPSMTSALEGGRGVVEKLTRVLISCVIMYVTRGKVKKFSWTSLMEAP